LPWFIVFKYRQIKRATFNESCEQVGIYILEDERKLAKCKFSIGNVKKNAFQQTFKHLAHGPVLFLIIPHQKFEL